MGYPWVAREGLSPKAHTDIVAAFTGIADPQLLPLMRAKSYIPMDIVCTGLDVAFGPVPVLRGVDLRLGAASRWPCSASPLGRMS